MVQRFSVKHLFHFLSDFEHYFTKILFLILYFIVLVKDYIFYRDHNPVRSLDP